MHDEPEEEDSQFGKPVAQKYIELPYDKAPWEPYHSAGAKWGIFTPNPKIDIRTEREDVAVRHYSRWDKIEEKGLMLPFLSTCKFHPIHHYFYSKRSSSPAQAIDRLIIATYA